MISNHEITVSNVDFSIYNQNCWFCGSSVGWSNLVVVACLEHSELSVLLVWMWGKKEYAIPRGWWLNSKAHSGTSKEVLVSNPVKCRWNSYQPSNNELDFGGATLFVRVRFCIVLFQKKRKIIHGFRNTQSSYSAFSFPLYSRKLKEQRKI